MRQLGYETKSKKLCKECAVIIRGRSDKKFCSSECRVTYHNRINYDNNKHIRAINMILRRNRKILRALRHEERYRVFEHELLGLNFNFNYYTNKVIQPDGYELIYCYEQAYRTLNNGMVDIFFPFKSDA